MNRRAVLGLGAGLAAGAVAGCGAAEGKTLWSQGAPGGAGGGAAAQAAAPPYAGQVKTVLTRYLKPYPGNAKPGYAGAVGLVMQDGGTKLLTAVGHALRYSAGPKELAAAKRVAMRTTSIFDLASLTKVYTTILVLQLVDQGKVALDAPVQRYLTDFTGAGKDKVTVAMLLAHTSALPVGAKVTGLSNNTQRWQAVMRTPLVSGGVPGSTFRYSSVGMMVLGRLVEKVTGKTLDKAMRDSLFVPMGLTATGFLPLKWVTDKQRLVATDARSSRGLLRGTVHDDVCNHLGGVAGHAGLFGTAHEVAKVGQMLLNGGLYGGKRILSAAVVKQMLTNVNKGKKAVDAERPNRTADHGLGVEMNQPWFMGRLASATAFGHTGFTGTSLLVVPAKRMVVVLLSNRAHPNWSWSNPDVHRVALHNVLAG